MRRRTVVKLSALAAFGASTCAAATAGAQTQTGYKANLFEPSERGSDWFANESLDLRGDFQPAIGVVGEYGYRGVIGSYLPDGQVKASILREQVIIHPGASFVLFDRLRLGVDLPIVLDQFGHPDVVNGVSYPPPVHAQSVGDLRVSADVRVAGEYGDPITFAVGGSVFAPIGQRDNYTGDGVWRLAPHLLAAGDIGQFAYAIRAGYEYRDLNEDYLGVRTGSTLTFGGAAGVRLFDKQFLIGPELFGQTVISNSSAFDGRATPIEAMIGAHARLGPDVRLNAGAGTMLVKGDGAAVFRGLLSLEWAPEFDTDDDRDHDGVWDDEDACPDVPGVRTDDPRTNGCPPVAPPADRDHDGVYDTDDACPDVPGVHTSDPKTNGCPPPPPDRDNDGIPDSEDACPDVPGIRTSDPKTNGCPSDRDQDGIYDKDDACPDVPGIHTDDPRTNGCPDNDRDKDGIPNDQDACPDTAGPRSNDPKTSGCPRVFIQNAQIRILEQPEFDTGRFSIKASSDSLLTEVAKVMADHPEIKKVLVQGHTDNIGPAAYNQSLSQQRAASVVKWLVAHGVAPDRLSSEGKGFTEPLVPNDTEAHRALNRRVEFHILMQDTTQQEGVKTINGAVVPVTAPH